MINLAKLWVRRVVTEGCARPYDPGLTPALGLDFDLLNKHSLKAAMKLFLKSEEWLWGYERKRNMQGHSKRGVSKDRKLWLGTKGRKWHQNPEGRVPYKQAPTDRLWWQPSLNLCLYKHYVNGTSFLELVTTLQPSPLTYKLAGPVFRNLHFIFPWSFLKEDKIPVTNSAFTLSKCL